jgi:hypothetical protein
VVVGAGEADQLFASGFDQFRLGRPAGQQSQHGGRTEIISGQDQHGRVGDQQVGAQPVEQADVVAGGPLIIASDRAQLARDLAMRNELAQRGVPVHGEQAADPGVLGVVFLARRPTAPCDQVRVDRHDGEPSVDQRLDQQPVPGLQHHSDLARIRLQRQTPRDQPLDPRRAMLDPELLNNSFLRCPQSNIMKLLRPVDTDPQHLPSLHRRTVSTFTANRGRHCAVLMNQSSRDDTLLGIRPSPGPGRGAVSTKSSQDKQPKHSLPGIHRAKRR